MRAMEMEPEQGRKAANLVAVHERALALFEEAVLPQLEIREHALTCRRFLAVPGAMWEGEWGKQFENSIRVEVDKLSRGIEKIVRDYRENRIVPDFRPAAGKGNQKSADTLDGMHRADSYHFKAQQARDNAFDEGVAGGFGAYRLRNEWTDPYDPDDDTQRINPGLTIVDADQRVFFDPNSKLYDKSDARYAFVITALSRRAFEEAYGPAAASDWPEMVRRIDYEFFGTDIVRIAEFYEVEERKEKLYKLTHALSRMERREWAKAIDTDELDKLKVQGWTWTERMVPRRRVHKYVMSGAEVLVDNGHIAGACIPIVPFYGKRWFVDNVERFRGHVSKRMDTQRIYNAKVSKLAEHDALAPRDIPIFAPEQMPANLADMWARQNIERHAFALVNPLRDDNGSIVVTGELGRVRQPELGPVTAALLQIASTDLTEDDQEVDQVKANVSADAMDIASARVDAKSGLYLDNMRQSVQREGEIYLSMAADVYADSDRVVETMSEDGDDGTAILQEPFTDRAGKYQIANDFRYGGYKVIADVTEATATRRDKTVKSALNTAEIALRAQDQELATASILTAIVNQDGEGMEDLKAFARKRGIAIGLLQPNEEEQAAIEEQQANAGPDPVNEVALAQVEALKAGAEKDLALADKAEADTALSEARAIETLAKAKKTSAEGVPVIRTGRELQG